MRHPKASGWAEFTRRSILRTAGGLAAAAAWGAGDVRLEDTPGEKVAVRYGEQALLDYRYDRSRPKPYVHPLYLPGGEPVTLDSPADHVHHRGLMLAWSDLEGFDFWGETNPGPHGRIVHQRFERLARGKPAVITALNHWIAGDKVLLVERRTLRIGPPPPEGIWMEWTSELTAPEPLSLAAGEHVYNGLGIRFPHSMDGANVLNERGTARIEKANGEAARWCTYFGPLGGVAFFDHPANPRHPTPFFVMNKPFGYISAAPTFREPLPLGKGGKAVFRWGVLSYAGGPEPETLNRLFRKWSQT
ncbi:MAG TPA: PmoA family protein [Bryobacteraceae bacterium]|nr:PmoA family protein [Bryobacteraceae bacterium]